MVTLAQRAKHDHRAGWDGGCGFTQTCLQLSHKPRGSAVGYKIFLSIGGAEKTSQKLQEASQKTQWILLMDHIRPAPDYADSKDPR